MTVGITLIIVGVLAVASGFMNLSMAELMTGQRNPNRRKDFFGESDGTFGGGDFGPEPGRSSAAGEGLLHQLAILGRDRFDLSVREYAPFDRVDSVHVPGSMHYGENKVPGGGDDDDAFDASGSQANMSAFANYVADNYGDQLDEVIWSGPNPVYISDGKRVAPYAVRSHRDHVHVGKRGSTPPGKPRKRRSTDLRKPISRM